MTIIVNLLNIIIHLPLRKRINTCKSSHYANEETNITIHYKSLTKISDHQGPSLAAPELKLKHGFLQAYLGFNVAHHLPNSLCSLRGLPHPREFTSISPIDPRHFRLHRREACPDLLNHSRLQGNNHLRPIRSNCNMGWSKHMQLHRLLLRQPTRQQNRGSPRLHRFQWLPTRRPHPRRLHRPAPRLGTLPRQHQLLLGHRSTEYIASQVPLRARFE